MLIFSIIARLFKRNCSATSYLKDVSMFALIVFQNFKEVVMGEEDTIVDYSFDKDVVLVVAFKSISLFLAEE